MKITFLTLLAILPVLSRAQNWDCSRFKNGSYSIFDPLSGKTTLIYRYGNRQIETDSANTYRILLKVKWIDACNYELTPKKFEGLDKEMISLRKKTVGVRIIQINEDSYVARCTIVGSFVPYSDFELIQIK